MQSSRSPLVGIFGASGYAGIELTKLLAGHPSARLAFVSGDRWRGESVAKRTGLPAASDVGALSYLSVEDAIAAASTCDAVLLATPAEASIALVTTLVTRANAIKIVDLSGAFRLRDRAAFEAAYGHRAPAAELLAKSVYGLPELSRSEIARASIVANPGCYPTAAALALGPLLRDGLISPRDLIVDAMSGVSGAGRRAEEEYSFVEMSQNARAYKTLTHQHAPEIAQTLASFASQAPSATGATGATETEAIDLTFTPHLIPVARGILSTAYARLTSRQTSAELTACLRRAYQGEPYVRVVDRPEDVSLHSVQMTNCCMIGVSGEPRENGRVVVVSSLDNLLKGAAGQALQNLNLILGLDERAGLPFSASQQHSESRNPS